VKSVTYHDTNFKDTVNRTHISEFFHYEEEAQGINADGFDLPLSRWDWDNLKPTPVGLHVGNSGRHKSFQPETKSKSSTCYIPTQIEGSPTLIQDIQNVCKKYINVFNTCLSPNPANILTMELQVDLIKWQVNVIKDRLECRMPRKMKKYESRLTNVVK